MKIRTGFVSNSSSSSFVVAIRNGEVEEQRVLELLKVPEDSPLYPFAKDVAKFIVNSCRGEPLTVESYMDEWEIENWELSEEYHQWKVNLMNEGWKVYINYASWNDGPAEESWISSSNMDYKDSEFVLWTQGGY